MSGSSSPVEQRTRIVGCLTEGMSIRATVRVTGAAKNTITKLLVDLGAACAEYQDVTLRNLPCERLQCDEIWSFCRAKAKNVPAEHEGEFGYGDVWTWTAICADTKLVPSWLVGHRDTEDATIFITDLAARLANRVQLTTDGHRPYLSAVESAFGADIDYAMLVKIYGSPTGAGDERRYSPAVCTGIDKRPITGSPDRGSISTSYVERQNLTIRMGMRRFTRLTYGFSKKVENLAAAVSLHFMHYNFAQPHMTLTKARNGYPTTPATATPPRPQWPLASPTTCGTLHRDRRTTQLDGCWSSSGRRWVTRPRSRKNSSGVACQDRRDVRYDLEQVLTRTPRPG